MVKAKCREFSYAEKKLLKHTDFFKWDVSNSLFENKVMRVHGIDRREDVVMYSKLCRMIKGLLTKLKSADADDPVRTEYSARMIEKLYTLGFIPGKHSLELTKNVTVWSFCQRRVASMMVKIGMVEGVNIAVNLIRHGHVRVGANVITDPAFLITRYDKIMYFYFYDLSYFY